MYSLPNFSIIVLFRFSSLIDPTKTLSAFILSLSNNTATSRPESFADKEWLSTLAVFFEVSCFLPLVASCLLGITFEVSLLEASFLSPGRACSLGVSFLSSFTSFFSFLFSETLFSFRASFLPVSLVTSLFSFLSSVTFSSLGLSFLPSFSTEDSFFKVFSKIDFTFFRFSLLGLTANNSLTLTNQTVFISCSFFLSTLIPANR